jgi:hypothetical protein
MPLFITLHQDGGALLEDCPTDSSVELKLDERATKCLAALVGLESFEIANALGQLWLAGYKESHRGSRRRAVAQPNS